MNAIIKQPSPIINADPLLTEREAADYLRVSRRTLQRWRVANEPSLSYLRVGSHSIRYRQSVLDAYLTQQTGAGVES